MHITKIDFEKLNFARLTAPPLTDEVVLTEDREKHIIKRRGIEFYNEYSDDFPQILVDPDYIFDDENNDTVIYVKKYPSGHVNKNKSIYINIVVRIVVEGNNPTYKNSIITAIGERDKTFRRGIRKRNLLYSKNGNHPLDSKE